MRTICKRTLYYKVLFILLTLGVKILRNTSKYSHKLIVMKYKRTRILLYCTRTGTIRRQAQVSKISLNRTGFAWKVRTYFKLNAAKQSTVCMILNVSDHSKKRRWILNNKRDFEGYISRSYKWCVCVCIHTYKIGACLSFSVRN